MRWVPKKSGDWLRQGKKGKNHFFLDFSFTYSVNNKRWTEMKSPIHLYNYPRYVPYILLHVSWF